MTRRSPENGRRAPGEPTAAACAERESQPSARKVTPCFTGTVRSRRTKGLSDSYSTTVALTITTGSTGTFGMPPLTPVATPAIASTTSIPSTTLPKTA